jgi:hypothetical protein
MSKTTFILMVAAAGFIAVGYQKTFHPAQSPVAGSSAFLEIKSKPASYGRASEARARQVVCNQASETFLASYLQAAFNSDNVQLQDEALDKWLAKWVMQIPTEAAQFVENIPSGAIREKALRILAQAWGRQNPEAAVAWASQLSEPERDMALNNVCLGLAGQNPEKAFQLAVQSGASDNDVLQDIVQQWSEKDVSGALALAELQPVGDARDQLIKRIAFIQSKADPLQAANLVVEQIQPGDTQNEAAMSVLQQWGQTDLAGASSWVERFPAGQFQERAIEELRGIAAYQVAIKEN